MKLSIRETSRGYVPSGGKQRAHGEKTTTERIQVNQLRKSKLEKQSEFENLDDVPAVTVDFPIKTHYSSYKEFKKLWNHLKQKDSLHNEIRSREIVRQTKEVKKLMAAVIMELEIRFAKVKCMRAIRERAQAMKNHVAVCQEITQRRNLHKCVHEINSGNYCLKHVSTPNNYALLIVKQRMHKRNVNTVIMQT